MLERLENLSALYANPHRFMNLAARLHAPVWLVAVGCWRLACSWLAASRRLSTRGNGTHYVCACAGGVDGSFCLQLHIFCQPCGGGAAPSIGLSGSRAAAPVGAVLRLSPWLRARFGANPCGAHGGCGMHASPLSCVAVHLSRIYRLVGSD